MPTTRSQTRSISLEVINQVDDVRTERLYGGCGYEADTEDSPKPSFDEYEASLIALDIVKAENEVNKANMFRAMSEVRAWKKEMDLVGEALGISGDANLGDFLEKIEELKKLKALVADCFDPVILEGVQYMERISDGKLFNSRNEEIGEWNVDCDDIVWSSEIYHKQHDLAVELNW